MLVGRPRNFCEQTVLEMAATAFVQGGYEGTSIDDLVQALNLHRGSLYKAFGSKRGLFLAALAQHVEAHVAASMEPASNEPPDVDLLLVAALERGHRDRDVARLVHRALAVIELSATDPLDPPNTPANEAPPPMRAIGLLGVRLYERLLKDPGPTGPDEPATHTDGPPKETDGQNQH